MIDRGQDFATHLQGSLERDLRAVIVYGPEVTQQVFLRDDLQGRYDGELVTELMRKARRVGEQLHDVGSRETAMGDIRASVNVFDNALLVHFILDSRAGIIVSVEPEIGRALVEFVDDCRERLGTS